MCRVKSFNLFSLMNPTNQFDFLGFRFFKVRNEVSGSIQSSFAKEINQYIKIKYSDESFYKKHKFSQYIISVLESSSNISKEKLLILVNFLKEKYRINPSWIMLDNNSECPMYIEKDKHYESISKLSEQVQKHINKVQDSINDVQIMLNKTT